jgi:hypothetical protein
MAENLGSKKNAPGFEAFVDYIAEWRCRADRQKKRAAKMTAFSGLAVR